MTIRTEKKPDFASICDLIRIAFSTGQGAAGFETDFADKLRRGTGYLPELALVAEENGNLMAHIMLAADRVRGEKQDTPILLLTPVCMTLNSRSTGIGTTMIQEALRRAAAQGYRAVYAVGNPDYYSQFGFRPGLDFGIRHREVPPENLHALELSPGALQNAAGLIEG